MLLFRRPNRNPLLIRGRSLSCTTAPIFVKAELDDMSGTLHCEEGDYKTSFSYFLESYEAFDSQDDPRALRSLKVLAMLSFHQLNAGSILRTKAS